jgi:glycosyltransferase involved in cell wall biosynthesis
LAAKVSFGKIRLIHSYHGHVLDGYFNRHLGKLFILIEKCLGKITDVFIFDSLSVKKEINTYRIFPKSEQHIILPGLIREVVGSHKFIEPLQKMIILVVARIEPVKRIDLVLSIAKDLKLRYANLEFEVNVVGDGQLKKELEQIAKNSQLPVKFLGWKDSVDAEYINSHVLLSTSDSEGTPISFMEAASFGLPIITTNVGGVSDLVEHNVTGLVIDGCVTEFSDAIHRLWMNPQVLLDLSMEATKKSKAEFSALRFRKKHRDVYENLFKV